MTAVLRQGDSSSGGTTSEKRPGAEPAARRVDHSDRAETLFYVFEMLSELATLLRDCEENSMANLLEAVCEAGPPNVRG